MIDQGLMTPQGQALIDAGKASDQWDAAHEREDICENLPDAFAAALEQTEGTIADWASWTDQSFPTSGSNEIEGTLAPVTIDIDRDSCVCEEPNV
tara:strand:- start:151 stop:435 length:285 start_codon:yes stop_codon:yes gene_type:complete